MLTLAASTATLLAAPMPYDRVLHISSDSTTVTILTTDKSNIADGRNGIGLTAYSPLVVMLKAGLELWAYTSGTPNISVSNTVLNAANIVRLT